MSNQLQNAIAKFEGKTPAQIVEDPNTSAKFIELYNGIHGSKLGASIYAKEQWNFCKMVTENEPLQRATGMSLYGCFLDAAVNGLSLEQGSKPHCYLLTRNVKTVKDNKEVWEPRAYMQISPYGELVMRMRAGQIKYADNPIVIYEGDVFKVRIDENGSKKVTYEPAIPRISKKIIGGYIKITRNDDTIDFQWMLQDDVERLKRYSNKNNKGTATDNKANALYTSNDGQIDPGFFEAKIIKHAFRSYPKVRTGDFTTLESQVEEQTAIDYGLNEGRQDFTHVEDVTHDDTSFAEPAKTEDTPGIQFKNDDTF